ncbi:putative ubiquitin-conjugating enzyme E2 39 [Cannabis sativa]|uniref:putative ubiquitin-conjugating enzyme E2 39 n=1 Tax=Cannabis sativa TaxID=3483 RepID=UPI0029CA2FED|nr:putative ubiquitin-conjugating enzyme E2 39 [Cannabis sativa]
MKLFGYDEAMHGLTFREAEEFYNIVKERLQHLHNASRQVKLLNLPKVKNHHHVNNNRYGEIEEIEVEIEKNFRNFKNFEILETPPLDHHFLDHQSTSTLFCFGVYKNKSLKKIMRQEWEILSSQLLNSIFYIRVYESRCDLMRVVVINEQAATNSYHHGLFFFDLFFPKNYPSNPPKIVYYSYEKSLHEIRGVVCGNYIFKNWDSMIKSNTESPILNVLVSIKNFISNSIELERSIEDIFQMLRSPLIGYEDFVLGYFLLRAHHILLNYKNTFTNPNEENYKTFFNLIKAFEEIGAYCKHHYKYLESYNN